MWFQAQLKTPAADEARLFGTPRCDPENDWAFASVMRRVFMALGAFTRNIGVDGD